MKHSDVNLKIEHQLYYHLKLLVVATILFLIMFVITYPIFNPEPIQEGQAFCGVVDTDDRVPYIPNSSIDGAVLFKNNCASCHNKNMKSKSTGPALGGVIDRWESQELLYDWIKNSQAVVASGDEYAVALYKEYGSVMTSFPNLTDEEITAILDYIEH